LELQKKIYIFAPSIKNNSYGEDIRK
jgi:hypothetical protein